VSDDGLMLPIELGRSIWKPTPGSQLFAARPIVNAASRTVTAQHETRNPPILQPVL